jgi:hypothetical protein
MSEFRYVDDNTECVSFMKGIALCYSFLYRQTMLEKIVLKLYLRLKYQTMFEVGWTKPIKTNQSLIFTWNLLLVEGSNIWIDKNNYEYGKYVCVRNFKDFPCQWFE